MLLAASLALGVCVLAFDTPLVAGALLLPAACLTFALAMLIGHFITEPLAVLIKKARAQRAGAEVDFTPAGGLYEADELASALTELVRKARVQQADLARKEKRQNEFVGDVAHELRTPLTAIRGNAEMLLDPDLPPDLHRKMCTIIISESERLTRLTNDLLTLQRIESGSVTSELRRINLRALAEEVVATLRPILEERQAHTAIVGEAPDVLGSPDRLKQALTNLVANASRFIEPGGHITVELCGLHGNSVIQVKDDGAGFGDIDPNLLFGRFYRTDASRARNTGGTGLGLAIVKSIVEEHDGAVEAVNLPEGGACFIMAIPSIAEG